MAEGWRSARALVAPTITIGVAQFNLGFAGTISARASTLIALLEDYVRSLARHGFERILFLNGHGGNIAPAKAAFQDLYAKTAWPAGARRLRLRIRSWCRSCPAWSGCAASVRRLGGHARDAERGGDHDRRCYPTRSATAPAQPPRKLTAQFLRDHAGDNHYDAATHRHDFPDGRVGSDSALASAAHGERLLEAAIADAVADYQAFLDEK